MRRIDVPSTPWSHGIRLAGCAALLSLTACASLTPSAASRPAELPVPASLSQPQAGAQLATPTSQPAELPSDVGWQGLIESPTLREVVQLALVHNRSLRSAALNVQAARAEYRIREAATGPTLDLDASAARSRSAGVSSTQYSVTLGISAWELDLWGRLKSLESAALSAFMATEATRLSVQQAVVAETAQAWLNLAAQTQLRQLAEQTLAARQDSLRLTERRQALGAETALSLQTARAAVASAQAELASTRTAQQQARNALRVLLGTELPVALAPDAGSLAQAGVSLRRLPAEVPASVLLQRPDVRAAAWQLQASEAELAAAQAALLPTLSLTASVGTAAGRAGQLFGSGTGIASLVPGLKWPVFDGGAARAAVDSADVARSQQWVSYESSLQTAFQEAADALAVRADLADRLQAQQALVAAQQQVLDLTERRKALGADDALAVLDAQRTLWSAQQTLVSLQLTDLGNRLTLYKVLGGQ